jgi:hypothetical protein
VSDLASKPPKQTLTVPKITRTSVLRWVSIAEMRVSERAQRAYRDEHAQKYADDFDLEGFGIPVVNFREGHWYIIDGMHRVAALKKIGWGDQQIQCEAFEGLTESQEAELFLKRNNRRAVKAFDAFRVAVVAGRPVQCDIDRIVRAQGLKVSADTRDGSIAAVNALERIYSLGGPPVLARTLLIIRDAYAADAAAMRGELLTGMSLVCKRYDGNLDDAHVIQKLASVPGGALGVVGRAQITKRTCGRPIGQCVADTIVELINAGVRNGKRLDPWWS